MSNPYSAGQDEPPDPFAKGSGGQPPPNPEGQQPYPGGQQPYQGGQQPYPGGQQPYSGGQQPYPGGQQPYPGGQGGYQNPPGYPGAQNQPGQAYPGPSGYGQSHPGYPQAQPAYGQGYPGQPGGPGAPGGGYPPPYPAGAQGYSPYPGGAMLPEKPARPITVTLAFWAWVLGAVSSLVGLIIVLNSSVWEQAVAAGARASTSAGGVVVDAASLVSAAKVLVSVVFVVFAALYLFFAFMMYGGRNWARIVLTVLGALSVLSALTPTTGSVTVNSQTFTAPSQGPNWITAILAAAAIVLMFLPLSNAYFTASKAFRRALR